MIILLATISWPLLIILIVLAKTAEGFADGVFDSVDQTRKLIADRKTIVQYRNYFNRNERVSVQETP